MWPFNEHENSLWLKIYICDLAKLWGMGLWPPLRIDNRLILICVYHYPKRSGFSRKKSNHLRTTYLNTTVVLHVETQQTEFYPLIKETQCTVQVNSIEMSSLWTLNRFTGNFLCTSECQSFTPKKFLYTSQFQLISATKPIWLVLLFVSPWVSLPWLDCA